MRLVAQSQSSECLLACFTMLANEFGDERTLAEFRALHPELSNGASLRDFVRLCELHQLQARPVRVEPGKLHELALPALAHWNHTHFVVITRATARRIDIVDPAGGIRHYRPDELTHLFSGIAAEVRPGAGFSALAARPPPRLRDVVKLDASSRRALIHLGMVGLMLQVFLILSPLAIQVIVDTVIANQDFEILAIIIVAFLVINLLSGLLDYVRQQTGEALVNGLRYSLDATLTRRLLTIPWSFFEHRRLGVVLGYYKSFEFFCTFIAHALVLPSIDLLAVLVLTVLMLVYDPVLAAVVLGVTVGVSAARLGLAANARRYQMRLVRSSAEKDAFVYGTLGGLTSLKNNHRELRRLQLYLPKLQAYVDAAFQAARFEARFSLALKSLRAIEVSFVLYMLARSVLSQSITLGMLYAFTMYRSMVESRFESALEGIAMHFNLPAHLEQVSDVVDARARHSAHGPSVRAPQLRGALVISGLSVTPVGARRPVIDGLSLRLEPGEFVAVTGASGVGKTTLVNAILGLVEPGAGTVQVGGIEVDGACHDAFLSSCGVVMQADTLFSGSIIDNITLFDEAPDIERAFDACASASLRDEIASMTLGLNTNVGDMGGALSSGQRQRVLLARAFYRRPNFFLLDEATANLDATNEIAVLQALRATGSTVLFSTHSSRVVTAADRVIELAGSHDGTSAPVAGHPFESGAPVRIATDEPVRAIPAVS